MMEFLIFKDGKDVTESREEAIGVLQKAEIRGEAICTAENWKKWSIKSMFEEYHLNLLLRKL